ncbi:DNA-binding transcriptional regulator, Lrp family [Pseudonocardia thermophila]|jgi:Transcriptional regulators|uniref:DNA-binding transcriptional regulator, Lrp family n=1 Tax=Pseudonocardia thermophila TaxID=1848 RepID=A0A1M6RVW2_PSETH|nr:Lrp/AsnC family transcriptional regulator [Pseudonocardia thermophila]SHK36590.1 DNA-binding transcriptional regulator, Lrp family [Pseudonocardia thermophila]
MAVIDRIDERLLQLLIEDGRRTFSDMAADVGLSVGAVKRRVDRLCEEGIITGFTAQIDHTKLGWGVEAFTEVRFAGRTRIADIIDVSMNLAEVQAVYTIAGDPDALVHLRVRDMNHLQDVIDGLRRTGQVTGTKTLIVLGRWLRPSLPQAQRRSHTPSG